MHRSTHENIILILSSLILLITLAVYIFNNHPKTPVTAELATIPNPSVTPVPTIVDKTGMEWKNSSVLTEKYIPSENILGTQTKPWGVMYIPVETAAKYGMTGIITIDHLNLSETLSIAREKGIRVIVTLGSVDECSYYSPASPFDFYNYNGALSNFSDYLNNIYSQLSAETMKQYIDAGTLVGFRIFDEANFANGCAALCSGCGEPQSIDACGFNPAINDIQVGTRNIKSLPIGTGLPGRTDFKPGFADLIYEVRKNLSRHLGENYEEKLVIGSTSLPHFMILVAQRVDLLRRDGGQGPLSSRSTLASVSFDTRPAQEADDNEIATKFFQCNTDLAHSYSNNELGNDVIYFLANRSSNYNQPDNTKWWTDYVDACKSSGVDFVTSWSWSNGTSQTLQDRISFLPSDDINNACGGSSEIMVTDTPPFTKTQVTIYPQLYFKSGNDRPVTLNSPIPTVSPTVMILPTALPTPIRNQTYSDQKLSVLGSCDDVYKSDPTKSVKGAKAVGITGKFFNSDCKWVIEPMGYTDKPQAGYNFGGYILTENIQGNAHIQIIFLDEMDREISRDATTDVSETKDWKYVSKKINIPKDTKSVRLELVMHGLGNSYFDGVFLKKSNGILDIFDTLNPKNLIFDPLMNLINKFVFNEDKKQ